MISLCLPSRGRPDQLRDMWRTAVETATDPTELELIIRVDDDDASYTELRAHPRPRVRWLTGPRLDVMGALWNEAASQARGDVLMHCADDIRFRTSGWDTAVTAALARYPDRVAFVYGRDGVHDERLGTHGFVSREWVDAVGQWLPEHFSSDYNDTWLNDVAEQLGRRVYVAEVYTEHLHPAVGKGPLDQTHQDRLTRDIRDNNTARYTELAGERAAWADRLRAVMRAA